MIWDKPDEPAILDRAQQEMSAPETMAEEEEAEEDVTDRRYVPWADETRDCLSLALYGRTRDNEEES